MLETLFCSEMEAHVSFLSSCCRIGGEKFASRSGRTKYRVADHTQSILAVFHLNVDETKYTLNFFATLANWPWNALLLPGAQHSLELQRWMYTVQRLGATQWDKLFEMQVFQAWQEVQMQNTNARQTCGMGENVGHRPQARAHARRHH